MADNLFSKLNPVNTFVFDVDGVLTDGNLLIFPGGEFIRQMNIKDGYALQLAVKKGYRVVIISGATSLAVRERLEALGIDHIYQGVKDKKEALHNYMLQHKISQEQILFMGDDIPDLGIMSMAGIACCPADAAQEIQAVSDYISPFKGGYGCARDVIEKVLKLHGQWGSDLVQSL